MTRTAADTIIFTDLDGSLLDHHDYSFAPAQPALALARRLCIPVIPVTSKTAAEVLGLRNRLDNHDPFVIENGAAIAIPEHSSQFATDGLPGDQALCWLHLARDKREWQPALQDILQRGRFAATPVSALTAEQISRATGLSPAAAQSAAQRQFGEPLLWQDKSYRKQELGDMLRSAGLGMLQGGRFVHVQDRGVDKGRAVRELLSRWQGVSAPRTIGLGDSGNDIALLETVDHAVLIKSPAHDFPVAHGRRDTRYSELTGPAGWNAAVQELIKN